MSFQWLIDTAEQLSMNRKPLVAKTYSRNGIVRSVSRGFNVWRFSVKLPDGRRWTDDREYISYLEALNEIGTGTFQFNNTGYDWMVKYNGDEANINNKISVSLPGATDNQNELTIISGATVGPTQKIFAAGDFIQTASGATRGSVYTVAEDVAGTDTVIKLHRPIQNEPLEFFNTNPNLVVGANCVWRVQCVEMPNWTFMARDQVSWSGNFVLQEVLT